MRSDLFLLRSANMRIMHLGRKLKARQSLVEMSLQRANHDKHECFRVPTQGELEEVCQLLPC